ncbi:hypothetical protein METBIDRAFT_33395 [Metschnikowia bicuspidata var. bicuspidata NRRL YB-4993]|uniref:Uncharacterized protein n=1 Tax=Metschnikowia bicuspidata var. bicuspidata NRRL YB-4993 TaxID=869754 RepID=A0A1A0H530_9ASCO|nr:hypothetical protein METBIDRAFT_33395 [Metschnikowia bicuspidata var. bicuspidata NRRL YB-4993]OBA19184.1 hypothetical protein METBIDRAFT_33395 [Metschnikowia bicuspidata var. bicuspidata NRRL YB-4993]
MDSSFDVSFNASALLEDHQLDTSVLLLADDGLYAGSPAKKHVPPPEALCQSLSGTTHPELPCLFLLLPPTPALQGPLALVSGELFQMTHHLRQERNLHNNKIHKLLADLQGDAGDFALDAQLRTRVFKARVSRQNSLGLLDTPLDPLDVQLDAYLRDPAARPRPRSGSPSKRKGLASAGFATANENKENAAPVLEPSKRKLSDSARKPLKKSRSYASIPALQTAHTNALAKGDLKDNLSKLGLKDNLPKVDIPDILLGLLDNLVPGLRDVRFSPRRTCVPRGAALPGRPSLKMRDDLRIFLVDLLTGSVADATQFGTELNASNCEGFPLPDNANEVVQIPTNDTVPASAAQKMAIIRALVGPALRPRPESDVPKYKGFYSKREYDDQRVRASPEVTIFHDAKKRVRWADELEW